LVLRAEHIGSTAIPGMDAKPILDVQLSVGDLDSAAEAFEQALGERGFDVPAGRSDDPGLWAKRYWRRREHAGRLDVNLHVRLAGSPNERLALLFRDWFRAHPGAVPAYARFKRVLAGSVADLDAYVDVKDPVVDLVVEVAESWAAETGWTVGAPEEGGAGKPGRVR
jgi:GrpB-like predicted nucleotidyltransferase (UPF0157 family)